MSKTIKGARKARLKALAGADDKPCAGPSCYDLVGEIFESPGRLGASGLRDLSTNKTYLAGFGKRQKAKR